jgi:hypothetical protein
MLIFAILVRGLITRRLFVDTRKESTTRRIWQVEFRPRWFVSCNLKRQRDIDGKSFGDLEARSELSPGVVKSVRESTIDVQ